MKLSSKCAMCILGKANDLYAATETDEDKKIQFLKTTMRIVIESDESIPIPYLTYLMMTHLHSQTHIDDYYEQEKTSYNQLLLSMEESILAKISASPDPLFCALRYAMAGNFIDFGAFKTVAQADVQRVLARAEHTALDPDTCAAFRQDLKKATSLAYLADNAGEIVLDKLFVQILQQQYPGLTIRFFVRGKPTLNDVTLRDAAEVGLDRLVCVYTNGKAVPGTCLEHMDDDMADLIRKADVVISKGQGNFESMYGTGLNIYYLLLCKCEHFAHRFGMQQMEGVFINEKDVHEFIGE